MAVSSLRSDFSFVLLVNFGNFLDVVFVGCFFELLFGVWLFGIIFSLVLFFVDVLRDVIEG